MAALSEIQRRIHLNQLAAAAGVARPEAPDSPHHRKDIMRRLTRPARRVRQPDLDRFLDAAVAALRQGEEMSRRCVLVREERARVTEALRELSVDVPASQANFVWLPLGAGAVPFAAACERRGVLVRAFPSDGVRVTVGLPTENDQFLGAAEAALKGSR